MSLKLPRDEIHIWITSPEKISDPALLASYRSMIEDNEAAKIERFRHKNRRHQGLISRVLVRTVLSEYCDRKPDQWRFAEGRWGKPTVIDASIPLQFNLSHTKQLIVCAVVLQHRIGVDIESVENDNSLADLAQRFFSPTETNALFNLETEKQRTSRFFDYWTLKESCLKACGRGLSVPLDRCCFQIGADQGSLINHNIEMSTTPEHASQFKHSRSWLIYPNDMYRMAVNIQSSEMADYHLRFFETVPLREYREVQLPLPQSLHTESIFQLN